MNYEELVKALRWCDASFLHECGNCLYVKYKHCKDDCMDRMLRDVAAAIEALETEIRESMQKCAECGDANMPKRGEFEKSLHEMFDSIWDCDINHPIFQDTVGELMEAVLQAYDTVNRAKMEVQE